MRSKSEVVCFAFAKLSLFSTICSFSCPLFRIQLYSLVFTLCLCTTFPGIVLNTDPPISWLKCYFYSFLTFRDMGMSPRDETETGHVTWYFIDRYNFWTYGQSLSRAKIVQRFLTALATRRGAYLSFCPIASSPLITGFFRVNYWLVSK